MTALTTTMPDSFFKDIEKYVSYGHQATCYSMVNEWIHSEDDKLADPEKAKYWSNEIPGCVSVFFSGGGHLMTGNSEEINHVLDEFVEENK